MYTHNLLEDVSLSLSLYLCACVSQLNVCLQQLLDPAPTGMQMQQQVAHHDQSAWLKTKPESSALAQQGTPQGKTAPAIFLSHSGKQKPFVERLHDALVAVNHFPFFDVVSLPIASPFPWHIEEAALGCQLGVVVISHDFLTSKWPMLELGLFMNREPRPHILPLFYQLSPQDLKLEENLSKWRAAWSKIASSAGRNVDIDSWEKAVTSLAAFSGMVYVAGTSEREYIQKIVRRICKCIPNRVRYDLPHIQGERRLAEEVARLFEGVKETSYAVGLYGVGGLGKTTISKVMANFYDSGYLGKSIVIEFPSDGNKEKIVMECKNALKHLANLNEENLLNKVNNFDEVVQLMKEHLKKCDVFIAIDNVWENCKDQAKRVLEAGFGPQSKVLLTSRSGDVLKELLRSCGRNVCVMPVPTMDEKEAFQLFQEACGNDFDLSFVAQDRVDSVMGLCVFNEAYHPIALKSVGVRLKRMILESADDAEKIEENMSQVALNLELSGIEDLIKSNFVDLSNDKQYMFLDIAVVLIHSLHLEDYKDVHKYLALLYKEQYREDDICDLIQQLALAGVLELEGVGADRKVRVHDLYLDLAQAEAAKSTRFLLASGTSTKMVVSKCAEVERVILDEGSSFKLELHEFPKLRVLIARGHNFLKGDLCLEHVPSLHVLHLSQCQNLGSIKGWTAAEKLAVVRLRAFKSHDGLLGCISSMHRLQELVIQDCGSWEGLPDLHGCDELKELILYEPNIKKSLFSKNKNEIAANYLSSLGKLQTLRISRCEFSKRKFPALGALGELRTLDVWSSDKLEEISGLDALVNLQSLSLGSCSSLKKLSSLHSLARLRELEIFYCPFSEAMSTGVGALTTLERLHLVTSTSVKKVPNLNALVRLQDLLLGSCGVGAAEFDATCFASLTNLQELRISGFDRMKKFPNLNSLGQLKSLRVWSCESLEEISGMDALVNLETLRLRHCQSLKKLGGLKGSEDLLVRVQQCNALSIDESLSVCNLTIE